MRFQVTVPVAAPASTVWAVVTDPPAWPGFTESMDRVTWVRGDSIAVGNQARVAQPGLGENLWEVTDVTPGHAFTWRNSRPGLTTLGTHEVREAGPDGSELILGIDESGPLVPLVDLLVGARSRRYVEMEGAGLKRAAEARAATQPPATQPPATQPPVSHGRGPMARE